MRSGVCFFVCFFVCFSVVENGICMGLIQAMPYPPTLVHGRRVGAFITPYFCSNRTSYFLAGLPCSLVRPRKAS